MHLDLMALAGPLMTSPLLYPLLAGLTSLDGVLPMIPSEAAVLTAGVFAHEGVPWLPLVIMATALGVFIGDHIAYALARSVFGPRLIGRSKHLSRAVAAAGRQLDRRAGLLIVTSRFLPGGRVAMNAACGTARLPLSRFSPASAIAALAWAGYTTGLGFLGGATFAANPLLGLAVGFGLSLALGGLVELIRRRSARPRAALAGGHSIPSAKPPLRALSATEPPGNAWRSATSRGGGHQHSRPLQLQAEPMCTYVHNPADAHVRAHDICPDSEILERSWTPFAA